MSLHDYTPLFLSLALVPISPGAPAYVPTYLLLTRVGPCHSGEKSILAVNEMSIIRKEWQYSISGRLNVTRDIPSGWTVMTTMEKCQDIRNLDTCDHFKSRAAIEDGCAADAVGEDIYRALFDVTTPRLSCPIKAGNYQISNYPFITRENHFLVSESKISTSLFGYTYRLDGYSDEKKIICVEAYLKLAYSTNPQREDKNPSADDDDDDDDNEDKDKEKENSNGGDGDDSQTNVGKIATKDDRNDNPNDFKAGKDNVADESNTDHSETDAEANKESNANDAKNNKEENDDE